MSTVFKKLNLTHQKEILVVSPPDSFEPEIAALSGPQVKRRVQDIARIEFSLAFVTKREEVDRLAHILAPLAKGDALVWFAYPKASSKKYSCEFNRDTGWSTLGDLGFEPVRQVAIDEDWSALRFRRVEFIGSLKRDSRRALSDVGKRRSKEARGGERD